MAKKAEDKKADKPASKSGGKAKKKKWSKGKTRDKLANSAMFNTETLEKLTKEVPSYKLITQAVVSDRLKIRGSLARRAMVMLSEKGLIKPVVRHNALAIYTRATAAGEE